VNSKAIYKDLVESRRHLEEVWKPVGSGLERHRILPKHQGGTYESANCTYLTRREHIIAHYLLWRIHGNEDDRSAYRMMRGTASFPTMLGRKHSEETKAKLSKSAKQRGSYKPHTEETKIKISKANKGKQKWLGKTHTAETRDKQSKAASGRKHTEETKQKLAEAAKKLTPRPVSDQAKLKISKANKGNNATSGMKWWNDGKSTKMAKICPGPDWKEGRKLKR